MGDGGVSTPAASPSGESAQAAEPTQGAAIDKPTAPAVADDPDVELGDGIKLKRSELRDLHTRRKELDRGANEKFQTAAKLKREAEELASEWAKDVKSAMRKAGKDPVAEAERIIREAMEEFALTPEQKEARDQKAENERLKAEKAEREKQEKETKHNQEVGQWETALGNAFVETFQTVGLPGDPFLVAQMATQVEAFAEADIPITKELLRDIATDLRGKYTGSVQQVVQSASDDDFEQWLGDAGMERSRKRHLAKVQGAATKPNPQPSQPKQAKPKQGLTRAELDERISQRIGA